MDVDLLLPGHGDPIDRSPRADRPALRAARAPRREALPARSRSGRSAHELAQSLWGNIAVTQAYLTLSEVLGHTDTAHQRRPRARGRGGRRGPLRIAGGAVVTSGPTPGHDAHGRHPERPRAREDLASACSPTAPKADAGDREPVRHHGLRPAPEPGGLRAAGPRYAVEAIDTRSAATPAAHAARRRSEGYDVGGGLRRRRDRERGRERPGRLRHPLDPPCPAASTNVWARTLGIPTTWSTPPSTCCTWPTIPSRSPVDPGLVNGATSCSPPGVGLDASVVRAAWTSPPAPEGRFGAWYFTYAAISIFNRRY